VPVISPVPPSSPSPPGQASGTSPSSPGGFASVLGNAVDSLQGVQSAANQASIGAAAGTTSISQLVVATDQAQLATQLTVAIQNAALTAFNTVLNI
jgi:flagellar hook-basal body complex protein FliE